MPKLDNCFNHSLNRENILLKHGLDVQQKTVLLAPTFNEEFSILPYLRNVDLSRVFPKNMNLIVKLHGVCDQLSNIKNQVSGMKNVYVCESYESDELFFVSDLLISDVSSVIYEFLSLKKPVLLFDSPKQKSYINYDENDLEWLYRDVGVRFGRVEDLFGLINSFLQNPENLKKNFEIGNRFISVHDGSSAERVVQSAMRLLDNDTKIEYLTVVNEEGVSWVRRILQVIQESNAKFILYKNTGFEYSPQYGNFMLNHAMQGRIQESGVGLVVPLIHENEVHLQTFKVRVALESDLNFHQIGIQMTYAFAGQSREIEYFMPYSFLIDRELFLKCDFTDIENDRMCVYELLWYMTKFGYRLVLGYDCMIREMDNDRVASRNTVTENTPPATRPPLSRGESLDCSANARNDNESNRKGCDYSGFSGDTEIAPTIEVSFSHNEEEVILKEILSLDQQNLFNDAYAKIIKIDIDSIEDIELKIQFLLTKAKLLMRSDKKDGIVGLFDKVLQHSIALQPNLANKWFIEAVLTRGIYFLSRNEINMAYFDFESVLTREPANIKALLGKGMVLQFRKIYNESNACFNKVLELDFENIDAIDGLMKNAYTTRVFTDIEKALDNYLEGSPCNLEMLFTLAGICYEMKKYDKSVELIEKIMLFDSEYPGIRELLEKIRC